jgi:hypothetical protein
MDRPFSDREFVDVMRLMAKLPPTKKKVLADEDTLSKARCACDKVVDAQVLRPFNTGVIIAMDNVCPGCDKQFFNLAKLVCLTCKTVVARLKPCKTKSGFNFLGNRSYHLRECIWCNKDLKKSSILELEIFEQRNRKKP